MDDNTPTPSADALSPSEQAYIDSRGETPIEPETPEAESKPETPAESAKDGKSEAEKEPDVQKLVPHGAFEEERQRRKAAAAEAARLREELAFLKGQQTAIKPADPAQQPGQGAVKPTAQWTPAEIEQNPIGYLRQQDEERAASERQAEQQRQFQQRAERLADIGIRHAQEYVKTNPHYFDGKAEDGTEFKGAYTFMREKAAEALQARFPDAPLSQIQEAVNISEFQTIQEALALGRNAAAVIAELAAQNGWAPPQAKAAAKPGPTEAERIAELEKAQRGAKSLGAVPAGGGDGDLTLDAIANMSDEEFAKLPKGKLERAMGKR